MERFLRLGGVVQSSNDSRMEGEISSFPQNLHYSIALFIFILTVFSIIGNFLTNIILKSQSKCSQQIRMYRIQMALSHVIVCVSTYWMYIVSSLSGTWVFGNNGCIFYGFLQCFFAQFSILVVAAIAFNRASSLKAVAPAPLRETIRNSILLWIVTFALSSPPLFGWSRYIEDRLETTCSIDIHSTDNNSRSYLTYILLFGFIVPLAVIIHSYRRVGMVLFHSAIFRQQSQLKMAVAQSDESIPINQISTQSYESLELFMELGTFRKLLIIWQDRRNFQNIIRPLRTIFIIIVCFLCVWLPYAIVAILAQFVSSVSIGPYTVTAVALVANSYVAFPPVVHFLTDESFRQHMLDILC